MSIPIPTAPRGSSTPSCPAEGLGPTITGVASRYAEINEVLHNAADTGDKDLRDLWDTEEDQRLTGCPVVGRASRQQRATAARA